MNLSMYDENKENIVLSGVIKPLVRALKSGTSTAKENVVCALLRLAQFDENKVMIGRSGAIPSLVNLLESGNFLRQKGCLHRALRDVLGEGEQGEGGGGRDHEAAGRANGRPGVGHGGQVGVCGRGAGVVFYGYSDVGPSFHLLSFGISETSSQLKLLVHNSMILEYLRRRIRDPVVISHTVIQLSLPTSISILLLGLLYLE
ncbi:hypothetical protein RJ640_009449 [Escallonia rubra]|uniref:Uncharacterized protein n=1 Tax=Escallonia rubra TaxID=112253 RepID=A0AA88UPA1_9ASTE|nr:hypothetical protein RJ640_009449 [Escallonia rubra]